MTLELLAEVAELFSDASARTLLRRAHRPLHTPWLVLVAVTFYGALTGLDPPVVRALIGFALMLIAQRSGRRLPAVAALAAPGIVTALLEPDDTTSVQPRITT